MTDMIGFIGVGTMGEPMCRNLARKNGREVLAADRDPAPLQRLAADGVRSASVDEIAAECIHHHGTGLAADEHRGEVVPHTVRLGHAIDVPVEHTARHHAQVERRSPIHPALPLTQTA